MAVDGRGKLSGVFVGQVTEPCRAGHASAAASTRNAHTRTHEHTSGRTDGGLAGRRGLLKTRYSRKSLVGEALNRPVDAVERCFPKPSVANVTASASASASATYTYFHFCCRCRCRCRFHYHHQWPLSLMSKRASIGGRGGLGCLVDPLAGMRCR